MVRPYLAANNMVATRSAAAARATAASATAAAQPDKREKIGRGLLVLLSFTWLAFGLSYLKGLQTNHFESFFSLFTFAAQCEGTEANKCWFAVIPFLGVAEAMLGVLGMLAAWSFGTYEASIVLLCLGSCHAIMTLIRLLFFDIAWYKAPDKFWGATVYQTVCFVVSIVGARYLSVAGGSKRD